LLFGTSRLPRRNKLPHSCNSPENFLVQCIFDLHCCVRYCAAEVKRMRLITAKEASEALGVALPRVYELARLNLIPSIRLGPRQIRFDPDSLEEWAKRGGIVDQTDFEVKEQAHEHDSA
jgi:excisionase family DNA binding protein